MPTSSNLAIEGIRIGVNGLEAHSGQAYAPLEQNIGGSNYTAGVGQKMSSVGTVIALEKGVLDDLCFLSFEKIGSNSHPAPPTTGSLAGPACRTFAPESDVGLRTFDELNASLSQITGVPQTNARVSATFDTVKQSLPSIEKLGTFGPAQQTALAQLAIQYCNQMVETPALRTAFFGASLNPANTGDGDLRHRRLAQQRQPRHRHRCAAAQGNQHRSRSGIRTTSAISNELDALINKLLSRPDRWRQWWYGYRDESRVRCRPRQRHDADPVRELKS